MRNIYSFLNMRTLLNAQSLYTGWRSLSPSISSTGLATKMRRLIDARQFREALALFNQQPLPIPNDPAIILALKASANICDYQSGTRIHRQLSNEALANPRLQTSLIHFYSKCQVLRWLDSFCHCTINLYEEAGRYLHSSCALVKGNARWS